MIIELLTSIRGWNGRTLGPPTLNYGPSPRCVKYPVCKQ